MFEQLPPAAAWRFVDAVDGFEVVFCQRLDDHRYAYTSEIGPFHAVLQYDSSGLVLDYPGIATRFH